MTIPFSKTLAALVCLCASAVASAATLDRNGQRDMEVVLPDRVVLIDDLLIYADNGDWLFPLGQLADALGFPIQASATFSAAEGYVLTPKRAFYLDVVGCKVRYDGGEPQPFPCDGVAVGSGDIYVRQGLIEKWFPLKLEVVTHVSRVMVTPREKLPIQERLEREQFAARSKGLALGGDPGYPRVANPHGIFEAPFIDEQLQYTQTFGDSTAPSLFGATTQIGGEVLGFEAFSSIAADQQRVNALRLNFARRSPDQDILGPAGAREVQLFDVDTPAIPLIADSKTIRGVLVSSFPFEFPLTYDRTDIQGPLPSGWQVLLYRNEVLVDQQVSDGTGRFLFRNVELFYGRNLFRLSFFGPHGEQRDEYRTYNMNPSVLLRDDHDYRVTLGVDKGLPRATVQYAQNLFKFFTFQAGALQANGSAVRPTHGYVSIAGVNELFLFSATCAFDSGGGKGCEWLQQVGLGNFVLSGKYDRLLDYQSELFAAPAGHAPQTAQITGSATWLGSLDLPFSNTLEFQQKDYDVGPSDKSLLDRVSFAAVGFLWNHELAYSFAPGTITGKLDSIRLFGPNRVRLGATYNAHRINAAELEAQWTPDRDLVFNGLVRRTFDTSLTDLIVSASRRFQDFALRLELAANGFRSYSASVLASFSLSRDPREGDWHLSRDNQSTFGAASVAVYIDRNHNGVRDPGEPGVPGMFLVVNQRDGDWKTDENGIAFVPALRAQVPTDIALSLRSLDQPNLRPAKPGARFIPRAGKTMQLDLPLIVVGDIDGVVLIETKGGRIPRRGVVVELVESSGKVVATAKTARDGYYTFDAVIPGSYLVRVARAELERLGLTSEPSAQVAVVPEEGDFVTGRDFTLKEPEP